MKIAIKGHASRGKEVIQILKSLGGKKRDDLTGRMFSQYYFINCYGDIDLNLKINLLNHNFYTIEEFPFKIGDKVKDCSDDEIGTILGFIDIDGELMYVVNFEKSGHANMPAEELKLYKEMERNITLTLDKAQEWYKKGGELREIALQAFSKKELSPLPRSWEEFSYKYKICSTRYAMPFKYEALYQLEQLKNCWWNGWKPDWIDNRQTKYCVLCYNKEFKINTFFGTKHFLAFPTKEMAEEFLECFRDLIEKAGDLI